MLVWPRGGAQDSLALGYKSASQGSKTGVREGRWGAGPCPRLPKLLGQRAQGLAFGLQAEAAQSRLPRPWGAPSQCSPDLLCDFSRTRCLWAGPGAAAASCAGLNTARVGEGGGEEGVAWEAEEAKGVHGVCGG